MTHRLEYRYVLGHLACSGIGEKTGCADIPFEEWSGRVDLNHRPPGPEPGALARLRYAPTEYNGVITVYVGLRLAATWERLLASYFCWQTPMR